MEELNTTITDSEAASAWRSVRGSLHSVMTFFATLLVAWLLYRLLQVVKAIAELFREAFLFWNVAWSTSQRKLKRPLRLHPYLCETSYLDEVGVNELYHFFKEDIDATGMRVEHLHKVIMQYTHVLMCRDRMDGTLRGAMLLGIEHKGDYTLLKLGTTAFKNYYRGTPFINIIVASLILSELFKHPLTPIYTIGKVYSPKAYTFGLSMKEYYPVYNRETPEEFRKIFTEFAETYISSKPGRAKFNPETFVIEQEDSHVMENLTVLSEHELQSPHIKFFVERNPGWKKGHCLVVGFRVTWWDFIATVRSSIRKTLGKKKHHESTKAPAAVKNGSPSSTLATSDTEDKPATSKRRLARPKLLRRYTFQEKSANIYAVNNLEYDLAGEVVLSPTTKSTFTFQKDSTATESDNTSPGHTEFNIDLANLI